MRSIILILGATLLTRSVAFSQVVEYYAGHERTGIDIMWFKNFKNSKDEKTPFLFFSRTRASTDYHKSPTAFGTTNAVSYNFKNGLGIVGVSSFLNSGLTPKLGVQYYKQKGDFMFFGWLVADLKKEGNIDLFGLFRYQPKLNAQWRLYSQLELFPIYNPKHDYWNFTQRIRLGLSYHHFSFGLMSDFNQAGQTQWNTSENYGGFLRYDF